VPPSKLDPLISHNLLPSFFSFYGALYFFIPFFLPSTLVFPSLFLAPFLFLSLSFLFLLSPFLSPVSFFFLYFFISFLRWTLALQGQAVRQTELINPLKTEAHLNQTGKVKSVPEHTEFPHAFLANFEFWMLLAEIKEYHIIHIAYYASFAISFVRIRVAIDHRRCKNISVSLQHKIYSLLLPTYFLFTKEMS
jgi:hypothetical protein